MKIRKILHQFGFLFIGLLIQSFITWAKDCTYTANSSGQVVIKFDLPRQTEPIDGFKVDWNRMKLTFTITSDITPTFNLIGPGSLDINLEHLESEDPVPQYSIGGVEDIKVGYYGTIPGKNFELKFRLRAAGVRSFTLNITTSPPLASGNTVSTFITSLQDGIRDIPGDLAGEATFTNCITNNPPSATIESPTSDVTISKDGQVNFQGSASDEEPPTLSFLWDFAGGAPNSTVEDPGPVTFNTPGKFHVVFTVTDNIRQTGSDNVNITVTTGNLPPAATIDLPVNDVAISEGEQVNFQGSASDEDPATLSFLWDFAGGAPNSHVEDPGPVTFNTPGKFHVVFTVTDNIRQTGSDDVTITVKSSTLPNKPPIVAIVNPPKDIAISVGEKIDFQGFTFDDDPATLSLWWDFNRGVPPYSIEKNPGLVSFFNNGTFEIKFTATDNIGQTASDAITITVDPHPTATINSPSGDAFIITGDKLNFQGSATDNGTIKSYLWDFNGGAPNSTVEDPGEVTFSTPGRYKVVFTVTDNVEHTGSDHVNVRVDPHRYPIAAIVVPAQKEIQTFIWEKVDFQGFAIDSDPATLSFWWDFDGGVPPYSNEKNPGLVSFFKKGIFNIKFIVTNNVGQTASDDVKIKVDSHPYPIAAIINPRNDAVYQWGEKIDFQSFAIDSYPATLSFWWDFDGGVPPNSNEKNPGLVSFYDVGFHTITFTVINKAGQSNTTQIHIRVD